MHISLSDVFSPGVMPELTYINRAPQGESMTYEAKLKKALLKNGNLISITGGTKTGKTVLCNRVVGKDSFIKISGSQIDSREKFWQLIAEKLELPEEISISYATQSQDNHKIALSAKAALLNLLSSGINTENGSSQTASENTTRKILRSNTLIMDLLIKSRIVLVIDDFHYIDKEIQLYLARTLKAEIFNGLRAILLSLPHRSDDAIRLNPDLIGRMSFIELAPWSKDELKEIARKGFSLLKMDISEDTLDYIAAESALSPQLMQENCFNIAFQVQETDSQIVTIKAAQTAFKETVAEYKHYSDIAQNILAGPAKGRSRRKTYHTKDGRRCDIYGLILLSISADPPVLKISLEEIRQRMEAIIASTETLPNALSLSKMLKHVEEIIHQTHPDNDTIDWKNSTLYILDPFLLFYLRWYKNYQ